MSKLMRYFKVTLMSTILMASLTAGTTAVLVTQGCKTTSVATTPGKSRDEKLIALALGCKNVTTGVTLGIVVKRALLADGKITQAVSSQVTSYLIKVQSVALELNDLGGTFTTFDAGKDNLFKIFTSLLQARKDLEANGTIPGFTGLTGEIFKAIDEGLNILRPLFL